MTRRISQAGAIPYRIDDEGELEVLLITTRKGAWSIPKGLIDPGNTAEETAEIETAEEAGAIGSAEELLGTFKYEKFGGTCEVAVFALPVDSVLDTWDESSFRERWWLSAAEAAELVERKKIRRLIRRLSKLLR